MNIRQRISFHLFANTACAAAYGRSRYRSPSMANWHTAQQHCTNVRHSHIVICITIPNDCLTILRPRCECVQRRRRQTCYLRHSKALLRLFIFGFNQWILCCGIHRGYWKRDTQTKQLTQIYVMLAFLCESKKKATTDEKNSNSHTTN